MEAAAGVFPDARHIWCQWHLKKDVEKHLIGHFKEKDGQTKAEFLTSFNRLFYETRQEDFDQKAQEIEKSLPNSALRDYLGKLLKKKEKWGGPWISILPIMGIKSTQLVEVSNAALKKFVKPSSSLKETIEAVQTISESKVFLSVPFCMCVPIILLIFISFLLLFALVYFLF